MAATDTTISALQRNWDMVSNAVAGVDDATLASMPNEQSNPMNWLVWHMTRVVDPLHPQPFPGYRPALDRRRLA